VCCGKSYVSNARTATIAAAMLLLPFSGRDLNWWGVY